MSKNSTETSEKTKILQWVVNWLKTANNNENQDFTSDIPELVSLLQCMGFKLKYFENVHDKNDEYNENDLEIIIICRKSKMEAKMTRTIKDCLCPSIEKADSLQIWNISGCGPLENDKVSKTSNTIVPALSPSKNKLVAEMLQKILQMINHSDSVAKVDTLQVECGETNKCITSPVTPVFKWDVDTSPPKDTSSPIQNVTNSSDSKLGDILKQIKKLSEEAYELGCGKNNTYTKTTKRRVSDIKISPLANSPNVGTFIDVASSRIRNLSSSSSTKFKSSPNLRSVTPSGEKKLMPPPTSKFGMLRKPAASIGTTPRKSIVSPKSSTPIPRITKSSEYVKTASSSNTPVGISKLKPPTTRMRIPSFSKS